MKYDVCIMNPPFNSSKTNDPFYIKFINKVIDVSNKAIIISPATAFLSKSKKKNKNLNQKLDIYKPYLLVNDYKFYDAAPRSRLCISLWNTIQPNEHIKINGMEFENQSDIVLNNDPYLLEFYNKLSNYLSTHKSIYNVGVCTKNAAYVFDPLIRNKSLSTWLNKETWFVYFGVTFFSLGYEKYSDKLWNSSRKLVLPFDTEEKAKNCYNTIHKKDGKKNDMKDFYNLITLLYKYLYINLIYIYMPYLDFSKSYTDEELFKMIGIEYNKEKIDELLHNV